MAGPAAISAAQAGPPARRPGARRRTSRPTSLPDRSTGAPRGGHGVELARRRRRRPPGGCASGVARTERTVPSSAPGAARSHDGRPAQRRAAQRHRAPPVEPGRPQHRGGRRRPRAPGRSRGTARSRRRPGRAHTSAMSPCCTIRPARITTSRSATAKASSWSWVTTSVVVPAARRMSRRSPASRSRSPASRADSGSSSSSSRGSAASERASATRCRSPPDRVPGSRSAYPSRPTRASSSATRSSSVARPGAAAARSRRCGPR